MGYEIAGGLGIKLADPKREVYVMVETAAISCWERDHHLDPGRLQTHDHPDGQHRFNSIGGLSRSLGQQGFGTRYVYPRKGQLPGDETGPEAKPLPVDLAMNARAWVLM